MPKVSIIIPVYNVETLVGRCLDSIKKQTFIDYEVILINDGSKDNSLNIIKDYEEDKRFNVIDQKNSGPAVTRNRGIKLAKAEYIMFIDSDDWLDEDFLEDYVRTMETGSYDIVMGGFRRVTENKVLTTRKLKEGEFAEYMVVSPWAKIFRKKFLTENKLEFLDTNSSEDVFFNVTSICKGARIKIIENIGYYWYFNDNSLSNTLHKGFNQKVEIIRLLDGINYKDIPKQELNEYYIIRYCIWYLLHSGRNATVKSFQFEYHKLYDWLDKNIPNWRKNKYISLTKPIGEPFIHRFIIWSFDKLERIHLLTIFAKFYCQGKDKK